MKKQIAILIFTVMFTNNVHSHGVPESKEPVAFADLQKAMGMSFDDPVKTQVLSEGLYVLFGVGGNILVSSGEDGVLIVDDQFPEMWPALRKNMNEQGDNQIDFVVNTHWHFDHADGNKNLGQEDNTWIVAQANSREMMLTDQTVDLVLANVEQKAYDKNALPDITFDSSMQFHLNGQQIELLHAGPAHTTGDAAVIFKGANAVHLGDVYNNSGYPFIDAGNGGSLDGVIAFNKAVLAEIDPETMVVPGHGPVASYQDLSSFISMLSTVREKLVTMIKSGNSLEQIQAAGITSKWDEKLGDPTGFINRSYTSLTTKYLK